MFRKLLGLVFNRWVLLAVLLLAAALVLWIVGPLLAIGEHRPLETERERWIAIAALAGATALMLAWKAWRARRGNQAVVDQLLAAPPTPAEVESPDLAAVRERFERALLTLRRARFGAAGLLSGWAARLNGRYLYELPWYLIIGAPGSGKTTALRNCGLNFPLAQAMGQDVLRGVGGTRNCDWWFTDRAVLIDTAGRFTTQDSDRDNDRTTWGGFLKLLKQARPRQPLNGVLVTVSVPDLLTRGAIDRAEYAAHVRQRVQELHEQLGLRLPIYLLVTKCDLMAGFAETFSHLGKAERAEPWGFTFDLAGKTQEHLQRFGPELDALQQRLGDGLIDRLQDERDAARRARVYGFPGQFAALRAPLQEFVDAAFSPSPYEVEPLLRGVYFVSGTQEGTPIDRVLAAVARSHRLEHAIPAPQAGTGKSFFLSRLITEVVFAESGVAGTNLAWERRRGLLMLGGYAALALVTTLALAAWISSYAGNRRYLDGVAARVDAVQRLVQGTPNRASAELQPIVPALEATRALARAGQDDEVPWLGFGLDQGRKMDSAAQAAYERMLVDALLPRLALRIEAQLRGTSSAPEADYEALKAYLMLYDPTHYDAAALKRHVEALWDADFGRSLDAERRAALSVHLEALLAQRMVVSPLPRDDALVQQARLRLAAVPLPQRVYRRLRHQGLGREFPEFTIARAAGANAALVFQRASGAPLTRGVPGLFSYDGYHRGFQKQVAQVAEELAQEQGWVLGVEEAAGGAAARLTATPALVDEVRRLYLNDYASAWEGFIADIRLQPPGNLTQAIQLARLLSVPDNPLAPLLRAISRETTLGAPDKAAGVIGKTGQQAGQTVDKLRGQILGTLTGGTTPASDGPGLEVQLVDERFAGLRQLVTAPEGGKAPLEDTMGLIAELHLQLTAADMALKGGSAPPPSPVPAKARAEAARMPQPLRGLLDTLAASSAQVSQTVLRQSLSNEVRSAVGEFCRQAVAGRYPLDRHAARDVTQADFALLFGPGGKIDQLFQQKLAAYVDTTTRPWRFRAVEGTPLGGDSGSLPQFQRAAAIRETFFAGGPTPSLRLEFKPLEMDPGISQFTLDVDGQLVRYAHGPAIPMAVQWPGPRGSSQVRVQLMPPSPTGASGLVKEGPWALFRLFDSVRIDPGGAPERFKATFDIDGRRAVFEVTASSVRNPFRLNELAEFSCPAGL
ncbi:type VI secretion system membrane subunit TssM [Azohydromonas caseinilytica]|uniref:Type VI secretion system membrane subunit TssM n=1 Tax=Azohydromonas caseinilytica TaxID=2728836 RepID=A0A848FJ59_9BURK|nr:type VI secretion system membrane subunit TssM [Azohydromonas caseinilytica]NML18273.1 type VI secretion system membrane subunit TssM [Azohydromonas caseinilytica]